MWYAIAFFLGGALGSVLTFIYYRKAVAKAQMLQQATAREIGKL